MDQMTYSNLESKIFNKIQDQWKTLKKAFSDLSKGKGSIQKLELREYLKNWGLVISQDQFDMLYDKLDHDKDGKVSYDDFKKTAGKNISPEEFLYFR